MDIVVALLERGYSDEDVEAAAKHCRTLDAALSWLSSDRQKLPSSRLQTVATPLRQMNKQRTSSPARRSSKPNAAVPKSGSRSRSTSAGSGAQPRKSMLFNKQAVVCSICYEDVAPNLAVRFSCRHGWYCEQCVRLHAESCLRMGSSQMQCPECRETVQEHHLRQLLPKTVIESMHARSLEQAVASCSNLFACPTPDCSMRVSVEDGEEPRLDDCPKCHKSSCLRCGAQPYHHGLTCQQYSAKQAKKCGNSASMADLGLHKWMLKTGTQQCPQCKMAISKENLQSQKTQYKECHKMVCRNCNTKFCFKCLRVLTENVSCGCSIDAHGFVDPRTGKRIAHFTDDRKTGKNLEKTTKSSLQASKALKGCKLRGKRCVGKVQSVRNEVVQKGRRQGGR